jgi:protein SCO1/2
MQDGNLKPVLPGALQGVGIDQRLDQQIPLGLLFRDEAGKEIPLSTFFHAGKPVLLAPVYYRCPMLCTQILNGVASSLKAVSLSPGRDFEIVAFSFDPKDTPETAAAKKQVYLKRFGAARHGWHLLTGDLANIKALTEPGYHYKFDTATGQFCTPAASCSSHPTAEFGATSAGELPAMSACLVAATNRAVDQVLLFCFHYVGYRQVRRRGHEPDSVRCPIRANLRRVFYLVWRRVCAPTVASSGRVGG